MHGKSQVEHFVIIAHRARIRGKTREIVSPNPGATNMADMLTTLQQTVTMLAQGQYAFIQYQHDLTVVVCQLVPTQNATAFHLSPGQYVHSDFINITSSTDKSIYKETPQDKMREVRPIQG